MALTSRDSLKSVSKILVLTYVVDWIFIIGVALIGYAFSTRIPNHHPFCLTDPTISFPKEPNTISIGVVVIVALIAPAAVIIIISLLWIPGPTVDKTANHRRASIWRTKLWEWHAGWLGLAVAVVGAFMATEGLKDLYGKPRPDMLDRCDPDLSNIAKYAVGGVGRTIAGGPVIVTWEICRNKADSLKVQGFSSFPSGHCSFSFAGLTYFSLWLCSKFSVGFPYLSPYPFASDSGDRLGNGIVPEESRVEPSSAVRKSLFLRDNGAAPPVYTMVIVLVPIAVASFIAASRWFDHRHHGFDIIFGSLLGTAFAGIGFWMYNMPIRRGSGWSWGPRARRHAFIKTVGFASHVGYDNWGQREVNSAGREMRQLTTDVERGRLDYLA